MVPVDWARTDVSRAYQLPADRDALIARYSADSNSLQLATIFDYLEEHAADRVFVESPYVDFDYRSEFANLYARMFNPPPDKCERLLFFKDGIFLGFCVARPSVKPVGRSALAPPPSLQPFVSCVARHVVHPYGQQYEVKAWPFLSQDGVYGRCAHAAIWAIARYHHLRHNGPRCSIAAVVEASGTRIAPDKTSPSSGLYLQEVADAFAGLGLPAMPYTPAELSSGQNLQAIVCRYLNSGFPVALSTPRHLTVLIGYGYRDGKLFWVRSDDNVGPYQELEQWNGKRDGAADQWDMLLVPLPARIHVPGEAAEIWARLTLLEQAGAIAETAHIAEELKADKLRIRSYAIDSAEYKQRLRSRGLGEEVVHHHLLTPASVWIWVTEFQRRGVTDSKRVVGEVAIDATSHPRRPQPVFANFPGRVVAWLPGEHAPRAKAVTPVELYDSALPRRVPA